METERADFLVRGAMTYNSYFKKFVPADASVSGGKFLYINSRRSSTVEADEAVDTEGLYMMPGLIDIRMHIESSMLTSGAFCRRLAKCGVAIIASEPHEMANASGMQGMLDMIRVGKNSPVDIFYRTPSCVPSTSPEPETTGGIITCEEMEDLKENPWMVCVGEVMNYRTIIRENQLGTTRFPKQPRKKNRIFPIEGHCPVLLDLDLAKFLHLGINGGHTEHSLEELEQGLANGMSMKIQEKMLRREVLDYVREHGLEEHFCPVTDDVIADTPCTQGHPDTLIRRAVGLGMPAEQTVYNAPFISARRVNLLDRGAIIPGRIADLLLPSDLDTSAVSATHKNRKYIWHGGRDEGEQPVQEQHGSGRGQDMRFPEPYYHSIHLKFQKQSRLEVPMESDSDTVMIHIVGTRDGSTETEEIIMEMPARDGLLKWEGMGCLLTTVFERYGRGQAVGYGLVAGDCHRRGTAATSYAHDCHNILVVGANPVDMKLALNRVTEMQGGMTAADGEGIQAGLPLHVGGILSDHPAKEAGASPARVRETMTGLGYRHCNSIMSFCTLTLLASPALKLTDKGLIDVKACKIVSLRIEGQRT